MYIDSSSYPLVRMGYERDKAQPVDRLLEDFSALLDRGQAFVFFSDGDMSQEERSPEERKKVVLWMKARRTELKSLVRALVHAEPDAHKREQARAFAQMFGKAWGYPMLLVASTQEARQTALDLLKTD
ncbi:Uncharacterised protein [Delftia tsuruhatensis]|uniref:hypothetical protein n=1 Tax=Delftia tsuruhatensis TaxID=180282 RepID=UPI001E6C6DE2|nr:hypothetical protein [Delftia tsuruhatensis]CAB5681929.1 Uncharacterised protein [Delftia tsuruhatensis]CAC9675734.1 Uncharacterised protein [Delftia tsuruhatensis]